MGLQDVKQTGDLDHLASIARPALICPLGYVVGKIQDALLSLAAKVENCAQNISAF